MYPQFSDAVAVVTGGASGIGKSLCEQLAAAGAIVVVADRHGDAAEAVAAQIRGAGGRATGAALDVTDRVAFEELIRQVEEDHGRLDYLFNNAGIGVGGEAQDFDDGDWKRVIDVNLNGVIHGVMAAYPRMIRAGRGHIVNTASVAGLFPLPGELSYTTSKFAVVGLSHGLRAEASAHGVRVSVVCPGTVQTPIYETSKVVGYDRAQVFSLWPRGTTATRCASQILRGVAKGRATIVITGHAKALWLLYRVSPWLAMVLTRRYMQRMRTFRLGAASTGEGERSDARA